MKTHTVFTLSDFKDIAAHFGYRVISHKTKLEFTQQKHPFDSFRVPKGDQAHEGITEVKSRALSHFKNHLDLALQSFPAAQQARPALCEWFATHGIQWRTNLYQAWRTGDYGSLKRLDSPLQRLRNTVGYDLLDFLPSHTA